jgi:hypothetical protein
MKILLFECRARSSFGRQNQEAALGCRELHLPHFGGGLWVEDEVVGGKRQGRRERGAKTTHATTSF